MEQDDPLAATSQVDEFGMTSLHILSLSQTLTLDMLLTLMNEGNRVVEIRYYVEAGRRGVCGRLIVPKKGGCFYLFEACKV
eukprot:scaffold17149_cov40-Cylindrotheca_fusiformis.AAC.1